MPEFVTEAVIDVSAREFLDQCSESEIKAAIVWLREMGYIDAESPKSIIDIEWDGIVQKISGNNRLRLTLDDEEIIKQIANKL